MSINWCKGLFTSHSQLQFSMSVQNAYWQMFSVGHIFLQIIMFKVEAKDEVTM